MKCAIMQPTYFPWAGYLNLIGRVDVFVFLDDAQYERGTWHNRNRVLLPDGPRWLTVPARREFLGQAINQVRVDAAGDWREKHLRLLAQSYARHPHAADMLGLAGLIRDAALDSLAALNVSVATALARALGITTRLLRSSELGAAGRRSERVIAICERLGCDEYVSPAGAAQYLAEDRFTERTAVHLSFSDFVPAPYPQAGRRDFVSHLSILDVIANLGLPGAAGYVSAGAPHTAAAT